MLFLCCTRQPGINAYKLLGNRDEAAALNSDPPDCSLLLPAAALLCGRKTYAVQHKKLNKL